MLDAAELEAIRIAIGESLRPATGRTHSRQITPIPLIEDDRAAEIARPAGLKLAGRWALSAARRLTRATGARMQLEVSTVEIIEAPALREELNNTWTRTLEVEGRRGIAVVAIAGPMIEALATAMLGGVPGDVPEDRVPSATAMHLFSPAGDTVVNALIDVWQEEQACHVYAPTSPHRASYRRGFGDNDVVVVVTLNASGVTRGTVRLVARPDTLVVPPAPVDAVPVDMAAIEEALGAVEVEVKVELGRARLTMGDFSRLKPGDVVSLDQFVDDLLAVECSGIVKGHGRALVSRGVMAVEMADLQTAGSKAA